MVAFAGATWHFARCSWCRLRVNRQTQMYRRIVMGLFAHECPFDEDEHQTRHEIVIEIHQDYSFSNFGKVHALGVTENIVSRVIFTVCSFEV